MTMIACFFSAVLATTMVLAQDQPAPAQFQGTWAGTASQTWAQVSASNASALQCTSPSQTLSIASSLKIGQFSFLLSPHGSSTTTAGANSYIFPPYTGLNGTWAAYSGTTASIRVSGTLVCVSMQRSGNTLTLVQLGGAGFSVAQQCSPSASALVPSAFNTPYCNALPNSNNAPYQSTVLGVYTLQSGGTSSGAASTTATVALSMAAVLIASALALL